MQIMDFIPVLGIFLWAMIIKLVTFEENACNKSIPPWVEEFILSLCVAALSFRRLKGVPGINIEA